MPNDTSLISRTLDESAIYVVAGGNHVTVQLDRSHSAGLFDVIEVHAASGGGPPPHRHAFAEWFRVLQGQLTFCEEHNDTIICSQTIGPGGSVFVAPWIYHATLNLSDQPCRFEVIGQPAMMSGYFAQAGIRVADPAAQPDHAPPGPDELRLISEKWGIEFWAGPIDPSPPPA